LKRQESGTVTGIAVAAAAEAAAAMDGMDIDADCRMD
jgi:hypothetical protein